MANTKTFADMKKPVRQPTPEQIVAFEETGRAAPSVKAETRKAANTEIREGVGTETSIAAKTDSQEHANLPVQKSVDTDVRIAVNTEARKSANTETRISGPIVRLTIDLPEPDHTRFKTACAMTKRKWWMRCAPSSNGARPSWKGRPGASSNVRPIRPYGRKAACHRMDGLAPKAAQILISHKTGNQVKITPRGLEYFKRVVPVEIRDAEGRA